MALWFTGFGDCSRCQTPIIVKWPRNEGSRGMGLGWTFVFVTRII